MERNIPDFLYESLKNQYGEEILSRILDGFHAKRLVTLRVNTLKSDFHTVTSCLDQAGITYRPVTWSPDALIIENAREQAIRELPLYETGAVYLQNLSSMLPPILLDPQPNETILDMAAAPGGKTTQMASLSGGKAQITACEKNKIRAERLSYNLERQGAAQVHVMVTDASKLDDFFAFDKILLDAPCSGSGTVALTDSGFKGQFTKEYLQKTCKAQEALLRKALKVLKPGHEMVYSTCSILQAENEAILKKVLPGAKAEIIPIDMTALEGVPVLPVSIPGTLCVCPTELYEGFFAAKIRRKK